METKRALLNILSWNIKGFRETIDGVKINKLKDQQFLHKLADYDLVFLQETHLDKDNIGDIGLSGFTPGIHFLRPKRGKAQKASGGISVFVKTSLRPTVKILPQSNSDIVWTVIPNSCDRDTYIGSVYIPPENSSFGRDHTRDVRDSLERDIEYFSVRGNVIVCGDFNARTGTLTDYIVMDNVNNQYPLPLNYSQYQINSRCSMDRSVQKNGRRLADICIDNSICILNGRSLGDMHGSFTCMSPQGSSVIDYFLCSHDIMKEIGMMTVQPFTQFSDHRPLLLKIHLPIALPCKSKKPSLTTTSRPARHTNSLQHETQTHTRFYWDNDSANKLAHAFKTLAMRTLKNKLEVDIDATAHDLEECSREGVNKLADDLVHTLVQAAKMSTKHRQSKKKRRRKPNKKWFDRDCHIERKEVKSLLNAINRQPYNRDLQVKYFARGKAYNRTVKQKKKAYKQKLISNLNDALDKDPQMVWKMLRELKDSENAEGESKYQTSATKWINHLENLISADVNVSHERKRQVATELTNAVNDTQSAHLDHPITSAEVVQACRTLKNRKAPGKDGITNEIIKASLPDMCNVLNKLFNVILSTGLNPDSWKTGVNVPIYKSGDPTNPSNYRGITLNSALGKLFYQILNNRVVECLEDNDLLSKEQAGFRKGFRTTDHIFVLRKIIDKYINNRNGRIYACFVDFQKAFDSVWHDVLLLKLHNTGIQGKCFQTIRDMYRNSSVCVKTTDGYSRKIPVLKGVHQGNVLSPTLFNIFINDITNAMTGNHSPSINTNTVQIPCLLYADDIVILSQTKTGLQNKLDRLYDYCSAWGLQINRDKTKVIIFTRTDPKQKLFFKCGDDILETTDSYKYLGIIFHKSGSFTNAQDHLAKQANLS